MAHDLKIEIDRRVCMGVGDCERLAPSAFALDDEGLAVAKDPSSVDIETLRTAERLCPSGAITITE